MKDLLSKKFGMWTVINYVRFNKYKHRHLWHCKCECGNEKDIREDTLIGGLSKSCGCVNRHVNINNRRWRGFGEISATYWTKLMRSAFKRKINFDITINEGWELFLQQNRKCILSGLELTFPKRLSDYNGSASLDRIDSSKGYTIDNVQWVDKRINFMKLDYKESEFISLCKLIANKNSS